jgi:hypothetical protein
MIKVPKKKEVKEKTKSKDNKTDDKDKKEEPESLTEDVEIDLSATETEGFSQQIGIDLRVVVSESRKFSLTMQRSANDRVMDIASAIGEMI